MPFCRSSTAARPASPVAFAISPNDNLLVRNPKQNPTTIEGESEQGVSIFGVEYPAGEFHWTGTDIMIEVSDLGGGMNGTVA